MRPPSKAPPMAEYLIWSNEHRAWWKPARCGYTTLTHEAGRYTEAVADAILRSANFDPAARPNEVKCLAPPDFTCRQQFLEELLDF